MRCTAFREKVDELPLRERSASELARLQTHAAACAACAAYLESSRDLERQLAQLAELDPRRDLSAEVANALAELPPVPRPPRSRSWRELAAMLLQSIGLLAAVKAAITAVDFEVAAGRFASVPFLRVPLVFDHRALGDQNLMAALACLLFVCGLFMVGGHGWRQAPGSASGKPRQSTASTA